MKQACIRCLMRYPDSWGVLNHNYKDKDCRFRGNLNRLGSKNQCTKPPKGWYCTRKNGHDGPCAALPILEKKDTK